MVKWEKRKGSVFLARAFKRILLSLFVTSLFVLIGCVAMDHELADKKSGLASIPSPVSLIKEEDGQYFQYTSKTKISYNGDKSLAKLLSEDLKGQTGYKHKIVKGNQKASISLILLDEDKELPEEGYRIRVRKDYIEIEAISERGLFYGTRTLLQWLKDGFLLETCDLVDYPLYEERSSMLDVARKYMSIEFIKNHIREISYLKYNYLYLHLSDNEAFRLESKTYPKLVADKYYSKKEIKDLIKFAKKYHIDIVPEIDMPGHMAIATSLYTDWQLRDTYGNVDMSRLDLTNDGIYTFIENILEEYLPLFDSKYFHIGGDEYIPIDEYENFPQLENYAKEKFGPLAKAIDVYYNFINFANSIVKKHGKISRMWNDGLSKEGTIEVSNDIVVDVWITNARTYKAKDLLDLGFTIGNSNTSYLYYVMGIDWASCYGQKIYDTFRVDLFVNHEVIDPSKILGAKIQLWGDQPDAESEEELYISLQESYRALSQLNWSSKKSAKTYEDFGLLMNKIGNSPGFTGPPINLDVYEEVKEISYTHDGEETIFNLGQIYYIDKVEAKGKEIEYQVSKDGDKWEEGGSEGYFLKVSKDHFMDLSIKGKVLKDNIALLKDVTVSSSYDESIWPARYLVDGSLATRWSSFETANSRGQGWALVDLGETYSLFGMAIFWEAAYPGTYKVEVSIDKINWETLYQGKLTEAKDDIFALDGRGRYVRIFTNDFKTPYGISIYEIKIFAKEHE